MVPAALGLAEQPLSVDSALGSAGPPVGDGEGVPVPAGGVVPLGGGVTLPPSLPGVAPPSGSDG